MYVHARRVAPECRPLRRWYVLALAIGRLHLACVGQYIWAQWEIQTILSETLRSSIGRLRLPRCRADKQGDPQQRAPAIATRSRLRRTAGLREIWSRSLETQRIGYRGLAGSKQGKSGSVVGRSLLDLIECVTSRRQAGDLRNSTLHPKDERSALTISI